MSASRGLLVWAALGCLIACAAALGPWAVPVAASSSCDPDGTQASGAVYRICMPGTGQWNGDLVVYAHGYVGYNEPIAIPEDQLRITDDVSIPQIANGLGFAFATTSYRTNGLAVLPGIEDLLDLVDLFSRRYGVPTRVYLVGASEGGIITALATERHGDVFDGGLSTCGPVGNFQSQINYWGDARLLFDYFFPGVIPGSPVAIPQEVIDQWDDVYSPRVEEALRGNPSLRDQFLRTARIPAHPTDLDKTIEAVLDLLWYNVFATNDGVAKLGGQPYDNTQRLYRGSDDDARLNRTVPRFAADVAALRTIDSSYQTTGALSGPLVTLHTASDAIVPYWHEPIYASKITAAGAGDQHLNIPVLLRYGHCNFSPAQALIGFVLLVRQATGSALVDAERVLEQAEDRAEYRRLATEYGIPVTWEHPVYLPVTWR